MANVYILDTILGKPFPHTKEQRELVNYCGKYLEQKGFDNRYYDVEVYKNSFVIVYANSIDDFSSGNVQRCVVSKKTPKNMRHDAKKYLNTNRPASYIMANFENAMPREFRPFLADELGLTIGSIDNKYVRGSFNLRDILTTAKFCGCDELVFRNGLSKENAVIYNISVLLDNWK